MFDASMRFLADLWKLESLVKDSRIAIEGVWISLPGSYLHLERH
jgi:hypothetical protein